MNAVTAIISSRFEFHGVKFAAVLTSRYDTEIYIVDPENLEIFIGYGRDMVPGIFQSARAALTKALNERIS